MTSSVASESRRMKCGIQLILVIRSSETAADKVIEIMKRLE